MTSKKLTIDDLSKMPKRTTSKRLVKVIQDREIWRQYACAALSPVTNSESDQTRSFKLLAAAQYADEMLKLEKSRFE